MSFTLPPYSKGLGGFIHKSLMGTFVTDYEGIVIMWNYLYLSIYDVQIYVLTEQIDNIRGLETLQDNTAYIAKIHSKFL